MNPSNLILDQIQYRRLQILSKGWIYLAIIAPLLGLIDIQKTGYLIV